MKIATFNVNGIGPDCPLYLPNWKSRAGQQVRLPTSLA
jgi:hypothetical protein